MFRTSLLIMSLWIAIPVMAAINVSYIELKKTTGYEASRTYAGQIMASRTADLGFKMNGRMASVMVDIGDKVVAGTPLAQLDAGELSANLRNAEANVALATAQIGAMEAEVLLAGNTEQRFRRLRKDGHTPKQTYDEAYLNLKIKQSQLRVARAQHQSARAQRDAARVALAEASVAAPFSGVIQARHVDEGSQVTVGQPILRIVEQGVLEAHIGVPGQIGSRLTAGAEYKVDWQGQLFVASLKSVLPEIDPATRTQTAVFSLVDANIPLGSSVELGFSETIDEPGYWLPLTALTQGERGLWGVYVVNVENTVDRRLVELIHTESDRVFARGTLTEGDRVIDAGVHRIVPGQEVLPSASKLVSNAR